MSDYEKDEHCELPEKLRQDTELAGLPSTPGNPAKLRAVAAAMDKAFGSRAAEVARTQRDQATGSVAAVWDGVTALLERMAVRVDRGEEGA